MDDEIIYDRDRRTYIPPPNDSGQRAPPPLIIKPRRKPKRMPPQEGVKQFWDKFNTKYPGKVFRVLPNNPHTLKKVAQAPKGAVQQRAAKSYEEARADCIRNVKRIEKECRRVNQKYRDPHFDIEWDLKQRRRNCLNGLTKALRDGPKGVKRVTDIFDDPVFFKDGPTAGDVKQGKDGNCYLMAALCGLGNMKGLIDKICVAKDEKVGVYGFVFYRDGEWQQCIIDDKLYLRVPDYEEALDERDIWDDVIRKDSAEEYRRVHQTGSRALFFGSCSDDNETWLPLVEKAYAKAHGDYTTIDGGFIGEAIEDLTGGVTSEVSTTDILDTNDFWQDQLLKVGKEFLFGCATGFWPDWLDERDNMPPSQKERQGILEGHAYSLMEAAEVKGQKLCKLRNPWGRKEWEGKWSDGSKEWTAEWMQLLNHEFGNDGVFWISYEDLLKKFQHFDRTRIFGPEWHVTQQWTSIHVPWTAEYHSTKFSLTLEKESPVVIVLSQLDKKYFAGLEGPYDFTLQFRVERDGDDNTDYIVRSHGNYIMNRSVSTDISLEPGKYSILIRITASPNGNLDVEELLPNYAENRRDKLIQQGLSYDLAHAKGVIVETEKENEEREAREKIQKGKDREKLKTEIREREFKKWLKDKERYRRDRRRQAKKDRVNARRMAQGRPPVMHHLVEEEPDSMDAADGSQKDNDDEPVKTMPMSGDIAGSAPTADPHDQKDISAADVEQESIAAAVFSDAEVAIPVRPHVTDADNIVQPLSEVIAEADANTTANGADKPPTPNIQINGADAVTDVRPLPQMPLPSRNDTVGTGPEPFDFAQDSGPQRPDVRLDDLGQLSEDSDLDSWPSFDFDTDLDVMFESDSEGRRTPPHRRRRDPSPSLDEGKKEKDEYFSPKGEPWNAVAVVGLRVYSLISGDDIKLEVVRPSLDENGDAEAKVLDRDDPAKGAVRTEGEGRLGDGARELSRLLDRQLTF